MSFSSEGFNKHAVKFGNIDDIFDERGNRFLALRKIAWINNDVDPKDYKDYEDKAALELRTWTVDEQGNETPLKGMKFLTDNGPNELVKTLVHEGFGNTKDILKELRVRDDFKNAVETINESDEEAGDGAYFDMRSLLIDEKKDNEEEDDVA